MFFQLEHKFWGKRNLSILTENLSFAERDFMWFQDTQAEIYKFLKAYPCPPWVPFKSRTCDSGLLSWVSRGAGHVSSFPHAKNVSTVPLGTGQLFPPDSSVSLQETLKDREGPCSTPLGLGYGSMWREGKRGERERYHLLRQPEEGGAVWTSVTNHLSLLL